MKRFPHYHQHDAMDCGPTCLRMIAKYYGKHYSLQTLRESSFITREGVSMLGIRDGNLSSITLILVAQLMNLLSEWERGYLPTAPVDGKVAFM